MMFRAWNPRRQMGEDEIVPTIIGDHPVGRGEIDADFPFLGTDLVLHRRDFDAVERPGFAHGGIDTVDTVHASTFCRSGWAAANGLSLFAFSSARSNVG